MNALEWVLTSVYSHMVCKFTTLYKTLFTITAMVWLLASRSSLVLYKIGCQSKALFTMPAFKCFFASVHSLVIFKMACSNKALFTIATLIRLLTSVHDFNEQQDDIWNESSFHNSCIYMVSDHCVLSALSKVQISFVFQLDVPLFLPLRFPYQMIKGPVYCKSACMAYQIWVTLKIAFHNGCIDMVSLLSEFCVIKCAFTGTHVNENCMALILSVAYCVLY